MAVCGSKRFFFEDVAPSPTPKRHRRSSALSSPSFSPPPPPPIHHLRSPFPRARELGEQSAECQDESEWANLLVTDMQSAIDIEDARVRATRVLGLFQKSIVGSNGVEAAQKLREENLLLKEQLDVALKENTVLKHGVAIQHERLKQHGDKTQELNNLKQLLTQYQEQLRNLEINNYSLNIRLKQAEQRSLIPGRFHPDVF